MKIYFTPKGVRKLHLILSKQRPLIKKTIINDLMKISMAILAILTTTSLQSSASPLNNPSANALKTKIELFSGERYRPVIVTAKVIVPACIQIPGFLLQTVQGIPDEHRIADYLILHGSCPYRKL